MGALGPIHSEACHGPLNPSVESGAGGPSVQKLLNNVSPTSSIRRSGDSRHEFILQRGIGAFSSHVRTIDGVSIIVQYCLDSGFVAETYRVGLVPPWSQNPPAFCSSHTFMAWTSPLMAAV